MPARLFDGQTARVADVEVDVSAEHLRAMEGGSERLRWPLARVRPQSLAGGEVRLSVPGDDARLVMNETEWRALAGDLATRSDGRRKAKAWTLYLGLTALGASMVALIFIGIPAAAGPLARHTPPDLEARFGRIMELQLLSVMKPCDDRAQASAVLTELGARVAG